MMFKHGSAQGDLNGFLDAGSHIQGELAFEATFRVDGKITGKVTSPGSLVVGDGGEIDGEVRVAQVFVSGTLRGRVEAERLQIAPDGRVFADVATRSLVIEDGAVFEGRCTMTREAARAESAATAAPAAPSGGAGPKRLAGAAAAE
jgi:cytoskeletal protein CcmA (bactofilin family)